MDKTYKVNKISEDGTTTLLPLIFYNQYGVLENAVTFNMILHNISNILEPRLRLKYREGIMLPLTLNPREVAYIQDGTDVYCISEVYESEKNNFALTFEAIKRVN